MAENGMQTGRPVALIVGASGGLGAEIARELIACGYDLGLHYNAHADVCAALAAQAHEKGLRAVCYAADLSIPEAPATLTASFLRDFARIDALIWAAGIVRDAPLLTLKEEDLRATLNMDARAVFLLLKACSRQFLKQKCGAVVGLSSHAGLTGRIGGASYCMAQSALLALLKSAAREWGPLGVRVNAVLPPFVAETGMGRLASPEFAAAAQAKRVLKKPVDGAHCVALSVAALLENPAVSGQVVAADSRL